MRDLKSKTLHCKGSGAMTDSLYNCCCVCRWFWGRIHRRTPDSSFVLFTDASRRTVNVISSYTVQQMYSVCEEKTASLEYRASSHVLLSWNVTVQMDLCILKIHSFVFLYIYMCPCMFVQKKKKKLSIFLYCHCMSKYSVCLSLFFFVTFIKQLYLILYWMSVSTISQNHIPMK